MKAIDPILYKNLLEKVPLLTKFQIKGKKKRSVFSEIEKIRSFFDRPLLKTSDLIYLYGLSSIEEIYPFLKRWLEENIERQVVILEDALEGFEVLLSSNVISFLLANSQIHLYFLDSSESSSDIMKKIAWQFVFSRHLCISFGKEKNKEKRLFDQIDHMMMGVNLVASDYSDMGFRFFSNIYHNLCWDLSLISWKSLKGAFAAVPAIICGAGPSLQDHLPKLEKIKDRALFFVGGSALTIFSEYSLTPHFTASIDKASPYDRFKKNTLWEIPFFFRFSMARENFSLLHNPLIATGGYGSFPMEEWIYRNLKLPSAVFDGGWTVGTFLVAVATYLGCNPIILAGMDFGFSDRRYSGILETENERKRVMETQEKGDRVFTQKDWILAKDWMSEFARMHPDRSFYDLNGKIRNMKKTNPFEKILSLPPVDLSSLVYTFLRSFETLTLSKKQVLSLLKTLYKEFSASKKRYEEQLKSVRKKKKKRKEYPALIESQYLTPLWNLWIHFFKRFLNDKKEDTKVMLDLHRILFCKRVIDDQITILERLLEAHGTAAI